jgi:protein-tyrosine kinase
LGQAAPLHEGDAMRLATYVVRVRLTAPRIEKDTGFVQDARGEGDETEDHSRQPMVDPPSLSGPTSIEPECQKTAVMTGNLVDITAEHQKQLAEPDVVHIDRARLQAHGHLAPADSERLIANQFRHIKRPVIRNAFGKGVAVVPMGHLVMVTSALPGEGKTFSSINLALSMAMEKDLEVVVVDADVAKQNLSRAFAVEDMPGLLNVLADDSARVESLIRSTDIPGLSILPSGQCRDDDATELLASDRMEEVLERIGAGRVPRIVLFDSPPLLLTNESRVLASRMGQILLVVCAGVTPRKAVVEAIGYLDEEKPLGLILNQSKAGKAGSYYGYGSYGYGQYGAEKKRT